MAVADDRQATLADLRRGLRRFASSEPASSDSFTGGGPLNTLLATGRRSGGMIEFLGDAAGSLALSALLIRDTPGQIVVIDFPGTVSPIALELLGLRQTRVLIVRPRDSRLALWAAEQSLRCPGIVATLCRFGPRLGTTAARRLKLAAEAGGGLGLMIRPAAREPPFGDLRLLVKPLPSRGMETFRPRLEINTIYQRGSTEGVRCEVELSADANSVSLVSPMVRSTGPRRRLSG